MSLIVPIVLWFVKLSFFVVLFLFFSFSLLFLFFSFLVACLHQAYPVP